MTYRTEDGIYIRCRKGRNGVPGYVAEAKLKPFAAPEGHTELLHDLASPMWFEFGRTPDEAIEPLLAEVRADREAA